MNQTYFEWVKFDANVVRIAIATCTYKSTNVSSEYENESEYI